MKKYTSHKVHIAQHNLVLEGKNETRQLNYGSELVNASGQKLQGGQIQGTSSPGKTETYLGMTQQTQDNNLVNSPNL